MRRVFKRTLQSTFLLFFIPMILLFVTVTGTVSYLLASQQLRANAETNMNDTLTQTKDYLNEKLSVLLAELTALNSSSELRALIRRAEEPGFTMGPQDYMLLGRHMDNVYADHYSILDSIYFYYNGGAISFYRKDYVRTDHIPKPEEYMKLPFSSASRVYWLNLHKDEWSPASAPVASLYQWVEGKDGPRSGLLLIQLKEELFKDLLTAPEISPNGYLLLAGPDGMAAFKGVDDKYALDSEVLKQELLNAPEEKGSLDLRSDGGQRITVLYDTIGINKWKLAAVYPQEEIYSKIQYIKYISLSVIAAVVLIAIISSGILANRITRPLSLLTRDVNDIEKGNLEVQLLDHPNYEIQVLNKGIRDMLMRIQKLLVQVEHEQELKRMSELSVLQAQIQPHFLYNTLYSIKSLCDMGETEDASQMLTALSNYYRISISKGSPIISVAHETDHIVQYLYIQQMRYGDTFRYGMNIQEEMLDCLIVKLTLQPLVENAIYHGVKKVRHPGVIEVKGWIEGENCFFQVKDNGYGMEPERLEALRQTLESGGEGRQPQVGYGVMNVHRRLQLQYGPEYGLHYDSEPGAGTTVTVRFPKRLQGSEQEGGNRT